MLILSVGAVSHCQTAELPLPNEGIRIARVRNRVTKTAPWCFRTQKRYVFIEASDTLTNTSE